MLVALDRYSGGWYPTNCNPSISLGIEKVRKSRHIRHGAEALRNPAL